LDSVPKLDENVERLKPIDGLMPDPTKLPEGCYFGSRCPYACEKCLNEHPEPVEVEPGHIVRCHFPVKKAGGDK